MTKPASAIKKKTARPWTFLNNHAHTLICLARNPDAVLRDVAQLVGITERAVQLITSDLVECGVLIRERVGRCNTYIINPHYPLRHPLESEHTIEELLSMLLSDKELQLLKERWDASQ